MDRVLINESHLTSIADAIRRKTGTTSLYAPAIEMPAAIDSIQTTLDGTLPTKSSGDITVNKSTFTVASGIYSQNITKTLTQVGTVHAPTISKGSISNNSITLYTSTQCDEGYINNGNVSATINVSAADITSGTISIHTNGTHDVTAYSSATVKMAYDFEMAMNKEFLQSDLNTITRVRQYQFAGCSTFNTLNLPNCTSTEYGAFLETTITDISLPNCVTLGPRTFQSCHSLSSIYLPQCTTLSLLRNYIASQFYDCGCSIIDLPKVTSLYATYNPIANCSQLQVLKLDVCSILGNITDCPELTTIMAPQCKQFGGIARCSKLESLYLPECSSMGQFAAANPGGTQGTPMPFYSLSYVYLPKCQSISLESYSTMASYYPNLKTFYLGSLISSSTYSYFRPGFQMEELYIGGSGTFSNGENFWAQKLVSLNLPNITILTGMGLGASQLTTLSLPQVQKISCALGASKLSIVSLPECVSLIGGVFNSCCSLSSVSLPKCTTISGYGTFGYCSSLQNLVLPSVSIISGNYTFSQCINLTTLSLPKCRILSGGSLFYGCSSLQTLSLPIVSSMNGSIFAYCYTFSLYLGSTSVCKLDNGTGLFPRYYSTISIYVPTSLLNSYKTATGWTYFSSNLFGY